VKWMDPTDLTDPGFYWWADGGRRDYEVVEWVRSGTFYVVGYDYPVALSQGRLYGPLVRPDKEHFSHDVHRRRS
jgi:hypothetical protein